METINRSARKPMQVLDVRQLRGGNRKLVATECGEYLVIDMQYGEITRMESYDTPEHARMDFLVANYPTLQAKEMCHALIH